MAWSHRLHWISYVSFKCKIFSSVAIQWVLLSITTVWVHAARRLNQKQLRGLYNVSKSEKTFKTTRLLHCFKRLKTRENPQHEVLKLLLQQRKLVEIIITISFLNSNIDLSELWYVNLSPTCCLLVSDITSFAFIATLLSNCLCLLSKHIGFAMQIWKSMD